MLAVLINKQDTHTFCRIMNKSDDKNDETIVYRCFSPFGLKHWMENEVVLNNRDDVVAQPTQFLPKTLADCLLRNGSLWNHTCGKLKQVYTYLYIYIHAKGINLFWFHCVDLRTEEKNAVISYTFFGGRIRLFWICGNHLLWSCKACM